VLPPTPLSVAAAWLASVSSWQEFSEQAPELAARVLERFVAHQHKTMATIRPDGSPRISGTEVPIQLGQVYLGGMTGNKRFADLRRDPRVAIHSGSDDPDVWSGDAKLAGRAVEVTDDAEKAAFRGEAEEVPSGEFELFRVDLAEAVVVRLSDGRDSLLIDVWREGGPVRTYERR
jgi:Pyridoxamine 5'-phosphate oxidase